MKGKFEEDIDFLKKSAEEKIGGNRSENMPYPKRPSNNLSPVISR